MSSKWNMLAAAAIRAALAKSEGMPPKQRIAAVDAAYPFGERDYHPYKQWLKVRRQMLFNVGLLKDAPRGSVSLGLTMEPGEKAIGSGKQP